MGEVHEVSDWEVVLDALQHNDCRPCFMAKCSLSILRQQAQERDAEIARLRGVLVNEALPMLLSVAQLSMSRLETRGVLNGLNVHARRVCDAIQSDMRRAAEAKPEASADCAACGHATHIGRCGAELPEDTMGCGTHHGTHCGCVVMLEAPSPATECACPLEPFRRYITRRKDLFSPQSRNAYPSLLVAGNSGQPTCDIRPEDWDALAVPCHKLQPVTDWKCLRCGALYAATEGAGTQSNLATEPDDCRTCGGSGRQSDTDAWALDQLTAHAKRIQPGCHSIHEVLDRVPKLLATISEWKIEEHEWKAAEALLLAEIAAANSNADNERLRADDAVAVAEDLRRELSAEEESNAALVSTLKRDLTESRVAFVLSESTITQRRAELAAANERADTAQAGWRDAVEAGRQAASHDWGCSGISEQYHYTRVADMDALRAIVARFDAQGGGK